MLPFRITTPLLTIWSLILFSLLANSVYAQESSERLPIIDVHVHAMKHDPAFSSMEMCPWFLKDMPGADPNGPPPSVFHTNCAVPLQPAHSDQEMQDALLETC